MATNRFYTPSLPQYTSQFVEDKTPYNAMLALNQQKIGRADAALAGAAQAQSQDLVPEVVSDYEQQLAQWQEKHGQHIYSVPAMRDLTRIQGQFQADQRVKNVQLDREQNEFYDRFRASPQYDPDTDPNLDPEGRVRQIGAEEFRQYENPILIASIDDEIDDVLKSIKPRSEQWQNIKHLKDEKTGISLPVISQGRRNVLEASDFDAVREDVVSSIMKADTKGARYIKAKLGDDFTEDAVREIVAKRERLRYVDQPYGSISQISGYGKGQESDQSFLTGQQFPLTGEEIFDKSRPPALNEDKVNLLDRGRLWDIDKTLNYGNNRPVYNQIKDDAAALLEPDKYITDDVTDKSIRARAAGLNYLNPDVLRKSFIRHRALNDYDGTVDMFDEHFYNEFQKYGLDITGKSDEYINKFINKNVERGDKIEFRRLNDRREDVNKWLKQVDEQFKIKGPVFESDNDMMEAAHLYERTKNNPDYTWTGFEERDIIQDHEDFNMSQKAQIEKNMRKWVTSETGKTNYPRVRPFSAKSSDPNSVQNITGQLVGIQTNSDGMVVADGSPNGIFMGSAVIRPGNNPEDQLSTKEKNNIAKKGTVIQVTGMVDPMTTGMGAGWLALTAGDEQLYMRGSDEFVESQRLNWNAYSYEIPKNNNVGEYFGVRGLNRQTGDPILVDRWNKEKMGDYDDDIWMNTLEDPFSDPENPTVLLKVYSLA